MTFNYLKIKLAKRFPFLDKYLSYNSGYIFEELKPTDFSLGASPLTKKVLQENADWTDYLPSDERQSGRGLESMACVSFSFLNVLETLFKRKYNLDINFSDRFLAKASGTTQNGNVQSRVADTARKVGLVLESDYPSGIDDFSWSEFYKPLTKDLTDKALKFLNEYEIGYEAVPVTIPAMREALKYSPLWAAGYAWAYNGGVYVSAGTPNHAIMIANIEQAVAYKKCFDTYNPFIKRLAANYQLYFPKILTLNRKNETYNIGEITNLLKRGLKYIMLVQGKGEIYELSTEGLKYISPAEWRNIAVQLSAEQKQLVGISNEFYQKLLA